MSIVYNKSVRLPSHTDQRKSFNDMQHLNQFQVVMKESVSQLNQQIY